LYDRRKDFFDYHAPAWDNLGISEKQIRIRQVFDRYLLALKAPLLDLGCGTGVLIPVLLDRLPANSNIIEFDLAYRMLVYAKAKIGNGGLISHINGDAHFLPFADQSISTAICFESFPHFRESVSALKELQRVLHHGGDLIIIHLMGREKLNKFHDQVGGAIYQDYLPSFAELNEMLTPLNFELTQTAAGNDLFLAVARKR
jgi:ubiquinone/menaquinone biosynthesis C-methylase UbiE